MVIGIGGASRSGKTLFAEQLAENLTQFGNTLVLCQDDFIVPVEEIPLINGEIDWEHPDSLDYARFKQTIRTGNTNFDYVIAEGFMLYPDEELTNLCDLHFFCEVAKETFVLRRREDRRYGPDEEWYIEHVWNSFLKYGVPPEDLIVHRVCDAETAMKIIRNVDID